MYQLLVCVGVLDGTLQLPARAWVEGVSGVGACGAQASSRLPKGSPASATSQMDPLKPKRAPNNCHIVHNQM